MKTALFDRPLRRMPIWLSMLALALLSILALACFTIAGCARILATRLATRQSRHRTGI